MSKAVLEVKRNNYYQIPIIIMDEDGVVVNLTDKTITMAVKKPDDTLTDDTGAVITKTISVTNAAAGECSLELFMTDTSELELMNYKFDFRITDGAGNAVNSMTGILKLVDIVTNE